MCTQKPKKSQTKNWMYKCLLCEKPFFCSQGLAGHQKVHRYDERWRKSLRHHRIPIPQSDHRRHHPSAISRSHRQGTSQQAARSTTELAGNELTPWSRNAVLRALNIPTPVVQVHKFLIPKPEGRKTYVHPWLRSGLGQASKSKFLPSAVNDLAVPPLAPQNHENPMPVAVEQNPMGENGPNPLFGVGKVVESRSSPAATNGMPMQAMASRPFDSLKTAKLDHGSTFQKVVEPDPMQKWNVICKVKEEAEKHLECSSERTATDPGVKAKGKRAMEDDVNEVSSAKRMECFDLNTKLSIDHR